MTDIGAVLRGLRDEVISLMGSITVTELPDVLFKVHEPDDETPLEEQVGAARLFTIEIGEDFIPASVGSNSMVTDVDRSIVPVMIVIQYPGGQKWEIAARSDYWLIVRKMIADQVFATGTCQRFVDVVNGFTREDMQDGDGFLMRIPIHCIVEHT